MDRLPDLQAAVRALEGVAWAAVVWPDPRGPAALHVTFDPDADARAVARGIFEAMREVTGEPLDVRWLGGAMAAGGARPVLGGVGTAAEAQPVEGDGDAGDKAPPRLELTHLGGTVAVPLEEAEAPHRPRAAAAAALQALGGLLPQGVTAELDWVEVVPAPLVDAPDVVHVGVTLRGAGGEERHLGAALVRGTPAEAAARATLDALNRRMTLPPAGTS